MWPRDYNFFQWTSTLINRQLPQRLMRNPHILDFRHSALRFSEDQLGLLGIGTWVQRGCAG
jgi:hypothetical protein